MPRTRAYRLVWVNSRALRLAGITRKTHDPAGSIVRDGRRGEPSGVLRGAVAAVRRGADPARDAGPARAGAARGDRRSQYAGITSAQNTAAGCEKNLDLFDSGRRTGEMTLRIYCSVGGDPQQSRRKPTSRLRRTSAKVSGRSALQGWRAVVHGRWHAAAPFSGAARSLRRRRSRRRRARRSRRAEPRGPARGRGRLADCHARHRRSRRADGADCLRPCHPFQSSAGTRPPASPRASGARRSPPICPRFGPLGVTASMQPAMRPPTKPASSCSRNRSGAERAAQSFPLAQLAAETRLLLGSAWPAQTLDPLAGPRARRQRLHPGTRPRSGDDRRTEPAEDRSRPSTPTRRPAPGAPSTISGRDRSAPGMLADLVVLSADVLDRAREARRPRRCAVTIFDGKIVHRRDAPSLTDAGAVTSALARPGTFPARRPASAAPAVAGWPTATVADCAVFHSGRSTICPASTVSDDAAARRSSRWRRWCAARRASADRPCRRWSSLICSSPPAVDVADAAGRRDADVGDDRAARRRR